MSHSSDNCEQIDSFLAICFTVIRPSGCGRHGRHRCSSIDAIWKRMLVFRDGDGDSDSGDGADERRTTIPGRDVYATEGRPGVELLPCLNIRVVRDSQIGGKATSNGRATVDDLPDDRGRESDSKIVKQSGIACPAFKWSTPLQ